jgi:hypothetical protein
VSHLANLRPFPKGVPSNPGGAKTRVFKAVRKKFGRALEGLDNKGQRSLAQVILDHAMDDDSPKQVAAWNIVISYGLGLPPKNLDSATVEALAEQMVKQMVERARQAAQEKALTGSTDMNVPSGSTSDK